MKHWVFVLVLAVALLITGVLPVQAQERITFERLQIDLWPEYDQTNILVIYHITLAAETKLPANVSLRIPARAVAPYNVAFQDVDGMLLNLEYTTQVDGDWLTINLVALSSVLQVEYYDPNLVIVGDQRSFEYTWPADVRVRNLSVNLQQPRSATQMTSSMTNAVQQVGADGLQYFLSNFGLIDSGQPLTVTLSYQKTDNSLSISAAPVAPIQATGSSSTNSSPAAAANSSNTPVLVAVVMGILILAGGLFWYTWKQRQPEKVAVRHRHSPARGSA
ncbi:MAG TPA: hypothetical protein VFF78_07640, partial [Anaerolineaceae bacterium]|nr:hypothetical protein [Anaerolineaceae bacterium]